MNTVITNELSKLLEVIAVIANKDPILFVGCLFVLVILFVVVIPSINTSYKTDITHSGKYYHGRMIK